MNRKRTTALGCVLCLTVLILTSFGCAAPMKKLTFEAEDWTSPAEAYEKDKASQDKWNLWSTDSDAMKKWSGGVTFQSPPVKADRATPEEGAPPLHTRITGIPNGRYEVEIKIGRHLAISRDGKTWERMYGRKNWLPDIVEITDGAFELWVDDRYADPDSPGSAYYDCITFHPIRPRTAKPRVQGYANERVREALDRGLVALPTSNHRVYLGWRLLDSDPKDIAFNVYRSIEGKQPEKLNATPIRDTTDFVDATAPPNASCEYTVRAIAKDGEGKPSRPVRVTASAEGQDCIIFKLDEGVTVQKVGIGDLDGDGRYDIVIKQPKDNIDPAPSYWKPSPDTYKIEAYTADGKRLWTRDLGWAIERGIWYSPMIVFDLDGDGKAEVAAKTGEGDPRGPDGRVETGPEYLSIFDGMTGKELVRTDWLSRVAPDMEYNYNLSSRNQICVAYLDGKTPCLIVARGTYREIRLVAYQFHGGKLKELWRWDNREDGRTYWGQGAHIMHAADVDADGRDEIIVGSAVVDDNGVGLWSTGLGHPDFCFVGDVNPLRPGLEIFYGIEPRHKENGLCLADAKTGELIWGLKKATNHVGTDGMCADIDLRHPGSECYAVDIDKDRKYAQSWLFSAAGEVLTEERLPSMSRPVHWDADLQREQVRGARIQDFSGGAHPTSLVGSWVAIADILGDWREEIITSAPGELRIYTTTIPAMDRRVCLMQDPIYRIDIAVVFMGYYAAPMLSYDIASGSPGMSIDLPSGTLSPGSAAKGEVVLQTALNAPLKGKLILEADGGAKMIPASAAIEVPQGQMKTVPFSVTPVSAGGIAEKRAQVSVRVRLETDSRTLRTEASYPVIDVPVTGHPTVEAEAVASQEGGTVQIRADKAGASGKAISHWDDKGHWIEWKIAAPTAGRYRVALRYCTPHDSVREFQMDGKKVGDRAVFPATGGFGGEKENHWNHAFVKDASGNPATWQLEAGDHTIRMTNLDGKGMNVDYLILVVEN
ncbi:MAG: hypothetical protein AB1696_16835 [Planctomycetota bacterium]